MFVKATKKKQRARVGLIGPAGSGKTYTALTFAKELAGDGRVAVIDTERGSASKYSGDVADFDVCELPSFEPERYIEALITAAAEHYAVVVIDSLSHAWEGAGGILDQVDQRGGRFDAWKDMGPQLRKLIDAILSFPGHAIATMRVKTEWVVDDVERNGRTTKVPRKVGLAPKFKEGLEYEFDIVGTLDDRSVFTVTKTRCSALSGAVIAKPGADVARAISAWLNDGVSEEQRITEMLKLATGRVDLNHAKSEIARAKRARLLDEAAFERLVAIGKEAADRVSGPEHPDVAEDLSNPILPR